MACSTTSMVEVDDGVMEHTGANRTQGDVCKRGDKQGDGAIPWTKEVQLQVMQRGEIRWDREGFQGTNTWTVGRWQC